MSNKNNKAIQYFAGLQASLRDKLEEKTFVILIQKYL